jgi:hypothetical protein
MSRGGTHRYPRVLWCRWKNNIERKNKFMTLLQDSNYDGDDEKGISRYVKRATNARIKV